MSLVVALDAGPLGLVTSPKRSPESLACAQWLQALVAAGARVVLPEIADSKYAASCCGVAASKDSDGLVLPFYAPGCRGGAPCRHGPQVR